MKTGATDRIKITVNAVYQENYSDPRREDHVFFYRIILENHGTSKISLLGKNFELMESFGNRSTLNDRLEVPMDIYPGQIETFDCSCSMRSPAGRLSGHFEVALQKELKIIDVPFPLTELFATSLLN